MSKEREQLQRWFVLFVTTFIVLCSALITTELPMSELNKTGIVIIVLMHVIAFHLVSYTDKFHIRGYLVELLVTLKYSFIMFLALSSLSFMLEDSILVSRYDIVFFIITNFLLLYSTNLFLKRLSFWHGDRKVYLITEVRRLDDALKHLVEQTNWDGQVVAVTLMDACPIEPTETLQKLDLVEREEMMTYLTKEVVDEVFINLSSDHHNVSELVARFTALGITVSVNLHAFDSQIIGEKKVQQFAHYSVMTFSTKFYKQIHVLAKRVLDIVGALVGLLFCGIVAIVIVPKIKADGGPAIFVQERVGKNGRVFKFYKFRSMCVEAEAMKVALLSQNTMSGHMFKMNDDPRITPIGKFIRKTSLDELPQFYNVLRGDMSLVGTRPPTVDEYNHYTLDQKRRLSFKPGITGLWQVSGRSGVKNFDEIVKMDIAYIDNWTIWSDIKILLKTIKVVLTRDGAQ